jgi:hypothetical protein
LQILPTDRESLAPPKSGKAAGYGALLGAEKLLFAEASLKETLLIQDDKV